MKRADHNIALLVHHIGKACVAVKGERKTLCDLFERLRFLRVSGRSVGKGKALVVPDGPHAGIVVDEGLADPALAFQLFKHRCLGLLQRISFIKLGRIGKAVFQVHTDV